MTTQEAAVVCTLIGLIAVLCIVTRSANPAWLVAIVIMFFGM